LNFSLQIEFSFPTGLSSYCQIFNLCILSSLINFSDHFLSTSASYYYLFFNFFRLYIYLCIIIIVIIVIIIILFILFYYLLLLFFCYYYIFFIFIFIFIFVWGPKNGLQQMPPLYNAYGAGVLRSKFYKDKPNWTPEIDLVEAWSIWNFVFTAILLSPKKNYDQNLVISRSLSGDPLNSNFSLINMEFHSRSLLAISFN
jgi:hypothetical protein